MPGFADEYPSADEEGIAHRVARRDANKRKATAGNGSTDAQGLIEFACECTRVDCERTVKVPLYVYRRVVEADLYLLQAGHHAFASYRTITSVGLMRIEERA